MLGGMVGNGTHHRRSVIAVMEAAIRAGGHYDGAVKLKGRIDGLLSNKPQTAACLARFLKIPDGQVVLRYYNAAAGTYHDER
jgi:hypothetical protein